MKNATTTEELEDAFNDHLKQTERHVKRLEKIFKMMDIEAQGKKCEAIEAWSMKPKPSSMKQKPIR
jgi:ferritin-like metal-binding protein YciE